MNARRTALLLTCLAVAGLLIWLAVAKWSNAGKVATVISALGAVAAVGVAVWAALPGSDSNPAGRVQATRTGDAIARRNSTATSGVAAPACKSADQLKADRTGNADASDGGEATSGVRLDDARDTE